MKVDRSEVEHRVARFQEAFRAAGVKLTHQRLQIFREVAASLEHPDAETVLREVRRRLPTVSVDTVYRTLWRLHDLGLVATLGPRRGGVRFDANLRRHHHYFCVQCGRACDFESPELDALRLPDAVQSFGSIAGTHVEVRGVCESCRKRARKTRRSGSPARRVSEGDRGARHE